MILYCPVSSVTTDRTFSISASLLASTLTPGKTAPDESFTTPAIALCANVRVGHATVHANAMNNETATFRIISLPPSPISHPPSLVNRQSSALHTHARSLENTDRPRGHPRHEFEGKRRANEEKCERTVKNCGAGNAACGFF